MAKKYEPSYLKACRSKWYDLPAEAVPADKREQYKARKQAVDMYIDGASVDDIRRITGSPAALRRGVLLECVK